jgi:hypothetical protein
VAQKQIARVHWLHARVSAEERSLDSQAEGREVGLSTGQCGKKMNWRSVRRRSLVNNYGKIRARFVQPENLAWPGDRAYKDTTGRQRRARAAAARAIGQATNRVSAIAVLGG